MADELPVSGAGGQEEIPQQAASAAPDAGGPDPGSGAAPPGGGTAAGGDAGYVGIRDALAAYGIDLRQRFGDDEAALQHLVSGYRQAAEQSQLAQYGQVYLQHAAPFQRWLEEQQKQQQAPQPGWWNPPEYDPRWLSQLSRDFATGEVRALPGVDPAVVQRYLKWTEHQKGFLDKFSRDPIEAIRPGLEQVIRDQVQPLIQQQVLEQREQNSANSFVAENSYWLHARDSQGHVIRDPRTGLPALSEWGERFRGYVDQAVARGLRDVVGQRDYALALLQRDYLLAQGDAPGAGKGEASAGAGDGGANETAKQNFLATQAAARSANASGSAGPGALTGRGGAPAGRGVNLKEMLKKRLQAGGFHLGDTIPGPG